MNSPRVLFLDIETAPAVGFFWGHTYQTDIIKVLRPQFVLSYAYQWADEKKIHFRGLRDYPEYKTNLENDFFLLKDLQKLMDEADVIIAHNGDKFDIRVIQGRFIRYRIPPSSPFRTIDTLRVCQREFRIESNRLAFVADYLGIGTKLPHTGLDLWERCMKGEDEAWDTMEQYNVHDIYLLREVYNVIKPYIKNHPNLAIYKLPHLTPVPAEAPACPTCQSTHTKRVEPFVANARKYPQFKCNDCGKYWHGTSAFKQARVVTTTRKVFATDVRDQLLAQVKPGEIFELEFAYSIAQQVAGSKMTPELSGNVRDKINRLTNAGVLNRIGKGQYQRTDA